MRRGSIRRRSVRRRFARGRRISRRPVRNRSLPRGLVPLRHRGFRLLASGQFASNFGDAFYAVALPWYVLAEHGGTLLLGTVLVAYGVPRTVLLAAGGHASDRFGPWTVMMASDTVRAPAVGGLAVAAALGPARAAVLVPIAAVLGAGEGLFLPGSFAIVPALLPDPDLQAGNALTTGGTQAATLVGPALGGALVALVGSACAFAVDAGTFVVSAMTLAGIRALKDPGAGKSPQLAMPPESASGPAPEPASEPSLGPALESVPEPRTAQSSQPTLRQLVRTEPVFRIMLLITMAANLGLGGMGGVAIPSLAHGPLHTGAAGYGGLLAAFAAGGLAGTVIAAQAGRVRRPAVAGSVASVASALFLALVPYLGGAIPAGLALAAAGLLNTFGNILLITAFQRWAPPQLLGRVTGVLMLAVFGLFPVSVAFAALVVRGFGPTVYFPIAAAILASAVLGGLTRRSWRDFGTQAPEPEPTTAESVAQA